MTDFSNKTDCGSPVGGGPAASGKSKLIELQRLAASAYAGGRYQESARLIRQALALRPNIAEAHNDLGASLAALERYDEAIGEYREAVRLKPGFYQARCNLAAALLNRGDVDAATTECERAMRDGPGYPEGHNVMGTILLERREIQQACQSFRQAIRLKPDHIEAHANLGVALLTLGDFACGWREYEWRRKRPGWNRPGRTWDGSDPFGKTLLLWAEGGLGNAIQFVRYASSLRDMGAQVVLEVHLALKPLLAGLKCIWKIAGHGEPLPHYDVHCPLISVAGMLGTDIQSIPAEVPYLAAESSLVEHWRRELSGIAGMKVGIVWNAEQRTAYGRRRSIPLEHYAPLAELPGVSLISLQKGWRGPADFRVKVLDGLDEAHGAFMDTAAIMNCLDLVITADTSTAHLAGALGVPVWVAMPYVPDWRWMLDRADSSWYPTMRLFRQKSPGDWEGVFGEMAQALRQTTDSGIRAIPRPSILAPLSAGALFDRISILRIKARRVSEPSRLSHVRHELAALRKVMRASFAHVGAIGLLGRELDEVNLVLWEAEDQIRVYERASDFGPRFVELARSVYQNNDRRSDVKHRIDVLAGSPMVEEKQYARTARPPFESG